MQLPDFIEQCATALWGDNPGAKRTLAYLESRGLRPETLKELKIGYCGVDQETPDNEPEQHSFMFKNRLIVPIRSEFGDPIAVAVRSSFEAEKGWRNSSASTGFDKREHLFLLPEARRPIFEANKAYLYEGYMDGIVVRQEGLPNVVVLMGTTLGLRRIGLLRRYCESVCLCLDSDPNGAGQVGQARSMLELASNGVRNLSRIDLPTGIDPDDFVRQHKVSGMLELEKPVTANDLQGYVEFVRQWRERRLR